MKTAHLREELLHYVWKMKKFNLQNLHTLSGSKISILHFGYHNDNAGPDFLQAKLKIDQTTWVGNVEMHLKSSDWNKHLHQKDPAYDNVILHVVYDHDDEVYNSKGIKLEVLELKSRIPTLFLNSYRKLINGKTWIPCQTQFKKVDDTLVSIYLLGLSIERLRTKSGRVKQILMDTNNNWEEVCYRQLLKYFGFKINEHGFERLALSLPYKLVVKYAHDEMSLSALFFGQSGLLEELDEFSSALQKEYQFLSHKYGLKKMQRSEWNYLRLRPANFPEIRIAQIIAIYLKEGSLFTRLSEMKEVAEIYKLMDCELNDYWLDHYQFGKKSIKRKKKLGRKSMDSIIINLLVPLIFSHGQFCSKDSVMERALKLFESVNAEKNSIISKWAELGYRAKNGQETQGLLQLKKNYCDSFRCLECRIGNRILGV